MNRSWLPPGGCLVVMGMSVAGGIIIALAMAFYYHPLISGIALLLLAGLVISILLIVGKRNPQRPLLVRCDYCGETVTPDPEGICPVCGAPTKKPQGRRDNYNDDERTFSV